MVKLVSLGQIRITGDRSFDLNRLKTRLGTKQADEM